MRIHLNARLRSDSECTRDLLVATIHEALASVGVVTDRRSYRIEGMTDRRDARDAPLPLRRAILLDVLSRYPARVAHLSARDLLGFIHRACPASCHVMLWGASTTDGLNGKLIHLRTAISQLRAGGMMLSKAEAAEPGAARWAITDRGYAALDQSRLTVPTALRIAHPLEVSWAVAPGGDMQPLLDAIAREVLPIPVPTARPVGRPKRPKEG